MIAVIARLIVRLLPLALLSVLPVMAQERPRLEMAKGRAVTIDGALAPQEWADAKTLEIEIQAGWRVKIFYKHDGSNLLFAFEGVTKGEAVRFPELLFDTENAKGAAWRPGQWWLHTSFADCEGNGEFNAYRRDGVFLCAKEKPGWQANNWPLTSPIVEMQVSFAKLGLVAGQRKTIGFALDLTDTSKNWSFWPAAAKLETPSTWGEAVILP